jgi:uncharacterized protein YbbC (DUF1343 family)
MLQQSRGDFVRQARSNFPIFAVVVLLASFSPLRADVLCGIDVLKREHFKPLDGRKIAIITNQTGRDRDGNRIVDLLHEAKNLRVVRLFSPEHGLYGTLDEKVGHGTDAQTGLKVYSLYGETRRPTDKMLEGVDTLVFDIQDIGTRYYTYVATMGNCMEEAAKRKLKFVVLDRPNPITGMRVDGPIAEKEFFGFTAFGPLPVTHGMTAGELARLFNVEYKIGCDLTVIECEGWSRDMWFDATNLTWINPSPNMRNLTQATLYPCVGLLEATNVSVGRGTDQPFETLGAPWIDGRKLATALNDAKLPGLRFVPIDFTPASSVFKGTKCNGVYILVIDREAVQPVLSGLAIAWNLRNLFGEQFRIDNVVRLLQNRGVLDALKSAKSVSDLAGAWKSELDAFLPIRAKYLLYR